VRWLVTATISYNVVEAVVALAAGAIASSIALLGFGLDSVIEVTSAAAVAWQFAARAMAGGAAAEHSRVGIVLAAVSLVVMPVLSVAQRQVGRQLG